MAQHDSSGARRRAGRKVRPHSPSTIGSKKGHFLEDETDRYVARYFGAGRARRREAARRGDRYRRAVERQVELALGGALAPSVGLALDGLRLLQVELNGAGSRVTVRLGSRDLRAGEQLQATTERGEPAARALAIALRNDLAVHVPRRRAPDVCVHISGDAEAASGGDPEEDRR